MRFDNKVRELATICLPWQQWTETTSVWFDDIGILSLLFGSIEREKVRLKQPELYANDS
jgi:hypothetical protein